MENFPPITMRYSLNCLYSNIVHIICKPIIFPFTKKISQDLNLSIGQMPMTDKNSPLENIEVHDPGFYRYLYNLCSIDDFSLIVNDMSTSNFFDYIAFTVYFANIFCFSIIE